MRRIGALGLSAFVHVAILGAASLSWLFHVEAVSEPPVVIRFVRALPPAPRVESFKAIQEEPPPPAEPERPVVELKPAPVFEPPMPKAPAPEPPPPLETVQATQTAHIQEIDPPLPEAMAHARAGASHDTPSPGSVDAFAPRRIVPGLKEAPLPEVGGTGATSGRPGLLAGIPGGLLASSGTSQGGPQSGSPGARIEAKTAADERADTLGRRYSVHLVDARELGRSTHDGWRYNQILPLLSDAYRRLAPLRNTKPTLGPSDDDIESVRIDQDAIQIAYRDGTRHVVVPTRDGLVALYVATGSTVHGKVEEAQRALGAMQRILEEGVRS